MLGYVFNPRYVCRIVSCILCRTDVAYALVSSRKGVPSIDLPINSSETLSLGTEHKSRLCQTTP